MVDTSKEKRRCLNRQFNWGIGVTPNEAVKLSRTEQEQVKVNVKEACGVCGAKREKQREKQRERNRENRERERGSENTQRTREN